MEEFGLLHFMLNIPLYLKQLALSSVLPLLTPYKIYLWKQLSFPQRFCQWEDRLRGFRNQNVIRYFTSASYGYYITIHGVLHSLLPPLGLKNSKTTLFIQDQLPVTHSQILTFVLFLFIYCFNVLECHAPQTNWINKSDSWVIKAS